MKEYDTISSYSKRIQAFALQGWSIQCCDSCNETLVFALKNNRRPVFLCKFTKSLLSCTELQYA